MNILSGVLVQCRAGDPAWKMRIFAKMFLMKKFILDHFLLFLMDMVGTTLLSSQLQISLKYLKVKILSRINFIRTHFQEPSISLTK